MFGGLEVFTNGVCVRCGKIFVWKSEVARHIQRVHSRESKCLMSGCKRNFYAISGLDKHVNEHHSPSDEDIGLPYSCISCQYTSPSKRNAKVHFRRKHSKGKLYRCKNCDRKFHNSPEVGDHWKRIHGKADNFLKCVCDICGKIFPRQGELRVHELLHAGVEYPGKFRGKTFKTQEYLNGHEKLDTTERIPCDICGKSVSS